MLLSVILLLLFLLSLFIYLFFPSGRNLSQPKYLSTKGMDIGSSLSVGRGWIFWNPQWASGACSQLLSHSFSGQIVLQSFSLSPLSGSYSKVFITLHITGSLASKTSLSLAHSFISVICLQVDSSFLYGCRLQLPVLILEIFLQSFQFSLTPQFTG